MSSCVKMNIIKNIIAKYYNCNKQSLYWRLLSGLFLLSLMFHKFAAVYVGIASVLLVLIANKNILKDIYAILLSKPLQLFLVLWIWAGVSLLWSSDFENGADTWGKILSLGFFLVLLFSAIKNLAGPQLKKIIYFCMIASFGIIAFYITINTLGIVIVKPLAYFFSLMFFPIIGFILHNKKYYAVAFALIYYFLAIYVMKYSGAQAAFYGFALGGAVFLLTLYKAEMTSLILKYGSVLFILLSPVLSYFLLAHPQRLLPYIDKSLTSFFHRLCIWNFVSNKIVEKPLLGWGLGASKHFPGGDDYFFQNTPASEGKYLDILYGIFGQNLHTSQIYPFIRTIIHFKCF